MYNKNSIGISNKDLLKKYYFILHTLHHLDFITIVKNFILTDALIRLITYKIYKCSVDNLNLYLQILIGLKINSKKSCLIIMFQFKSGNPYYLKELLKLNPQDPDMNKKLILKFLS